MKSEGIYIGEETAVIALMVAILKDEMSADEAISIALGRKRLDYDEIYILKSKENKSWEEIANIYGIAPGNARDNMRKAYSRYMKKRGAGKSADANI